MPGGKSSPSRSLSRTAVTAPIDPSSPYTASARPPARLSTTERIRKAKSPSPARRRPSPPLEETKEKKKPGSPTRKISEDRSRRLDSTSLLVGDEVLVRTGVVGVVRFIGKTVLNPERDAIGIELNAALISSMRGRTESFGRNDGTINGTAYFSTGPNRALFVFDVAKIVTPASEMKPREPTGASAAKRQAVVELTDTCLLSIFRFLPAESLLTALRVSRKWKDLLANQAEVWDERLRSEFEIPSPVASIPSLQLCSRLVAWRQGLLSASTLAFGKDLSVSKKRHDRMTVRSLGGAVVVSYSEVDYVRTGQKEIVERVVKRGSELFDVVRSQHKLAASQTVDACSGALIEAAEAGVQISDWSGSKRALLPFKTKRFRVTSTADGSFVVALGEEKHEAQVFKVDIGPNFSAISDIIPLAEQPIDVAASAHLFAYSLQTSSGSSAQVFAVQIHAPSSEAAHTEQAAPAPQPGADDRSSEADQATPAPPASQSNEPVLVGSFAAFCVSDRNIVGVQRSTVQLLTAEGTASAQASLLDSVGDVVCVSANRREVVVGCQRHVVVLSRDTLQVLAQFELGALVGQLRGVSIFPTFCVLHCGEAVHLVDLQPKMNTGTGLLVLPEGDVSTVAVSTPTVASIVAKLNGVSVNNVKSFVFYSSAALRLVLCYTLQETDGVDKLAGNVFATRLLIAHAKWLRMKTLRHLTPIMSPLVEGPAAEKMAKIVAASGLKTLDPKAKMPDELRDKLEFGASQPRGAILVYRERLDSNGWRLHPLNVADAENVILHPQRLDGSATQSGGGLPSAMRSQNRAAAATPSPARSRPQATPTSKASRSASATPARSRVTIADSGGGRQSPFESDSSAPKQIAKTAPPPAAAKPAPSPVARTVSPTKQPPPKPVRSGSTIDGSNMGSTLAAEMVALKRKVEELNARRSIAEEAHRRSEAELQNVRATLQREVREARQHQTDAEELARKEAVELRLLTQQLDTLKDSEQAKAARLAELEKDNALYVQKLEDLRGNLQRSESDRETLDKRLRDITAELLATKAQKEDLAKRLAEESGVRRILEQERTELAATNEKLAKELQTLRSGSDAAAGEGSFFVTQGDHSQGIQAVISGGNVVGGSSTLGDGKTELAFGEVNVGSAARVVVSVQNIASVQTVFEFTIPSTMRDVLTITPARGVLLEGEKADLVFALNPNRLTAYNILTKCELRSAATNDRRYSTVSVTGRGVRKVTVTRQPAAPAKPGAVGKA